MRRNRVEIALDDNQRPKNPLGAIQSEKVFALRKNSGLRCVEIFRLGRV